MAVAAFVIQAHTTHHGMFPMLCMQYNTRMIELKCGITISNKTFIITAQLLALLATCNTP